MSRETADHSLPYIIASAGLDGTVRSESFAPRLVLEPNRQAFLRCIAIKPLERPLASSDVASGYASVYTTRVEIETMDGIVVTGEADVPPGHPDSRFCRTDLETKLREGAGTDVDVEALIDTLWAVDRLGSVRDLTARLTGTPGSSIDAETAE